MNELDAIRKETGGCATGNAVVTGAGKLPAQFVFHAVGPVYRDGRHGKGSAAFVLRNLSRSGEGKNVGEHQFSID